MKRSFLAQMNLYFEKTQCASEHGVRLIFIEASTNKSSDLASAVRLPKLLGEVKHKDFGHK